MLIDRKQSERYRSVTPENMAKARRGQPFEMIRDGHFDDLSDDPGHVMLTEEIEGKRTGRWVILDFGGNPRATPTVMAFADVPDRSVCNG